MSAAAPVPRTLLEWASRLGADLHAPAADAPATRVRDLADDSRRAGAGSLFFARRGSVTDGAAFARDALARGAAAVVTQVPLPDDVPQLRVADVDAALLLAADLFHGRPQDALRLVGVTGTKGKTTVAWLAAAALRARGLETALLGTIHHDLGPAGVRPAGNTTPGGLELRGLLAAARDAGARAAVLEVSSHALDQGRVAGLAFDAGVFTNLGHDHLDYHPDVEAYFRAKARLFEGLGEDATALLNRDDARFEALARATSARVVGVGTHAQADLRIEDVRLGVLSTRFTLREGGRRIEATTGLVGLHNVFNLVAAAGAARVLGVDLEAALAAAAAHPGVPGRLERVDGPDGVTAFVDYAHTEEALAAVLAFLREVGADPLVCVVGCGGDRDRTKRPRMARTAARLADAVVLTSDNPRTEDPRAILADMEAGLDAAGRSRARTLADRREAIRAAVMDAAPGSTVLVAGKGHEKVQVVGNDKLPFDDVEEVRAALALRGRSEAGSRAGARR